MCSVHAFCFGDIVAGTGRDLSRNDVNMEAAGELNDNEQAGHDVIGTGRDLSLRMVLNGHGGIAEQ